MIQEDAAEVHFRAGNRKPYKKVVDNSLSRPFRGVSFVTGTGNISGSSPFRSGQPVTPGAESPVPHEDAGSQNALGSAHTGAALTKATQPVLVVLNRGPYSPKAKKGADTSNVPSNLVGPHNFLLPNPGGVSTAVKAATLNGGMCIANYPYPADDQRAEVEGLLRKVHTIPVYFNTGESQTFYNGVLWPQMHGFIDKVNLRPNFQAYLNAQKAYTAAVADQVREYLKTAGPGAPLPLILLQDYQIMGVASGLRQALDGDVGNKLPIGHFWHIPWPGEQIAAMTPHLKELIEQFLGADVIFFQTAEHKINFRRTVRQLLGDDAEILPKSIKFRGRTTRIEAIGISIDADAWKALGEDPEVQARARKLEPDVQYVTLGVDRLDFTKAHLNRLEAFEMMLDANPKLVGDIRMVIIAPHTRKAQGAFDAEFDMVKDRIKRLNDAYPDSVKFISEGQPPEVVASYMLRANQFTVFSLADGMHLGCLENISVRPPDWEFGPSRMLLSKGAGASTVLTEVENINPLDIESCADQMASNLFLPRSEAMFRQERSRSRVAAYTCNDWMNLQLEMVRRHVCEHEAIPGLSGAREVRALLDRSARAPRVVLVSEYDSVLSETTNTPDLAKPDRALCGELERAAELGVEVHFITRRSPTQMAAWFRGVPVGIHVGPGLYLRKPDESEFEPAEQLPPGGEVQLARALEIAKEFTGDREMFRGGFVEEKPGVGLTFHYRGVQPISVGDELGAQVQSQLEAGLDPNLVKIFRGDRSIEVMLRPTARADVTDQIVRQEGDVVISMGSGLDPSYVKPDVSIIVGGRVGAEGGFRLRNSTNARRLLSELLNRREAAQQSGNLEDDGPINWL